MLIHFSFLLTFPWDWVYTDKRRTRYDASSTTVHLCSCEKMSRVHALLLSRCESAFIPKTNHRVFESRYLRVFVLTRQFSTYPLKIVSTSRAGITRHACREFFVPKLQYLLVFSVYLSKTNNTFITSQWFLSSDITPTNSRIKRRIIAYGLVARYGPQSVASANG